MLTPNPAGPPAYTISDLDRTQNAKTALAGALIETEILVGQGGRKNTGTSLEDLAEFFEPFFGKGGASDGILFLPDGRVKLSPERQQQLADGKLFWVYDDGSGYRTQLQAKSFGVAPGNSADDNAKGVDDMRTYVLGLPS